MKLDEACLAGVGGSDSSLSLLQYSFTAHRQGRSSEYDSVYHAANARVGASEASEADMSMLPFSPTAQVMWLNEQADKKKIGKIGQVGHSFLLHSNDIKEQHRIRRVDFNTVPDVPEVLGLEPISKNAGEFKDLVINVNETMDKVLDQVLLDIKEFKSTLGSATTYGRVSRLVLGHMSANQEVALGNKIKEASDKLVEALQDFREDMESRLLKALVENGDSLSVVSVTFQDALDQKAHLKKKLSLLSLSEKGKAEKNKVEEEQEMLATLRYADGARHTMAAKINIEKESPCSTITAAITKADQSIDTYFERLSALNTVIVHDVCRKATDMIADGLTNLKTTMAEGSAPGKKLPNGNAQKKNQALSKLMASQDIAKNKIGYLQAKASNDMTSMRQRFHKLHATAGDLQKSVSGLCARKSL